MTFNFLEEQKHLWCCMCSIFFVRFFCMSDIYIVLLFFFRSVATLEIQYKYIIILKFSIFFTAFPYLTLLIGLMRSVPAASHSEHSTKITVVVTLWLITSYLMLHVPAILRNVFSVFNVWDRLVNMFNAHDDTRVPRFQTYIHILAYVCTCVWAIVRTTLCFKYNHKLRKALGP